MPRKKRRYNALAATRFWIYEDSDGSQYLPKDAKPFVELRELVSEKAIEMPSSYPVSDENREDLIELIQKATGTPYTDLMAEREVGYGYDYSIDAIAGTYYIDTHGKIYLKSAEIEEKIEDWFEIKRLTGRFAADSMLTRAKIQARTSQEQILGGSIQIDKIAEDSQQVQMDDMVKALTSWSFVDEKNEAIPITVDGLYRLEPAWKLNVIQRAIDKLTQPNPNLYAV